MIPIRFLACVVLLAGPFSAFPSSQGCNGCIGAGGSGSSSGGSCGGMLSIQVTVANGKCRWFASDEPLLILCLPTKGCKPTVTRTWSGLSSGSELDFCLDMDGQEFCLAPKPDAGASGAGSDSRDSVNISCVEGGGSATFTVTSPSCGLSASAEAMCSGCEGNA